MIEFKVEELKREGKGSITAVANCNEGNTHIVVDDSCWVIYNNYYLNGGGFSAWIFPEALEVLKKLPNSPRDYLPYINFIKES